MKRRSQIASVRELRAMAMMAPRTHHAHRHTARDTIEPPQKQLHAMFEKYVPSIILTLANKYIKNVNASELKLSLWGAPPPPPPPPQSISQHRAAANALRASIRGTSSTVSRMVGRVH